ncbi:MAG: TetR/AcrR family transcriptional regulator [Pseudomonadota bacterium]
MAVVKTRASRAPARRARDVSHEATPEGAEPVPDKRSVKSLQILSAAAKIFNERGYHGTSVADVAEALGVSKPFLYYYLKNKDDILFECSRIATEQLHAMLDEVRKTDVPGWERLELVFRGYARVMTTDFGICLIRNTAPGTMPTNSREKLWVGRRRLNREVEQIIARGIADGSIRQCDPIALSFAIFGAFNWITYWYRDNGPLSPDEISERFLDLFAHGARPVETPAGRKSTGK